MNKTILVFAWLISSGAMASQSFWSEAKKAVDDTWYGLYQCRLSRVSPYDPHLPRPMVPARDAITNYQWRLLAYYDEEWFNNSSIFVYKNPDGGFRHSVQFNDREIAFVTPYAGTVASARELNSIGGPFVEYRCRNYLVSEWEWRSCVEREFVRLITDQLCRFGATLG